MSGLFNGSTVHALSEAEMAQFFALISFDTGLWESDADAKHKNRIFQEIKEALKHPSARAQAREIIKANRPIEISFKDNQYENFNAYVPYGSDKEIVFNVGTLNRIESKLGCGGLFFHEAMHLRQFADMKESQRQRMRGMKRAGFKFADHLILDAETTAFTALFDAETNGKKDTELQELKQKWLKIARFGGKIPKGYIPFKPRKGLSRAELEQAREEYAIQMAGIEVRTRFMQNWLRDPNDLRHKDRDDVSVTYTMQVGMYTAQDFPDTFKTSRIRQMVVDGVLARNPTLKASDFHDYIRQIDKVNSFSVERLDDKVKQYNKHEKILKSIRKFASTGDFDEAKEAVDLMKPVIEKSQNVLAKRILGALEFRAPIRLEDLNYLLFVYSLEVPSKDYVSPQEKYSRLSTYLDALKKANSKYYASAKKAFEATDFNLVRLNAGGQFPQQHEEGALNVADASLRSAMAQAETHSSTGTPSSSASRTLGRSGQNISHQTEADDQLLPTPKHTQNMA